MSAICPSTEVDEVAICLLTVFEQRGLTFELLEALIKQEVEETGMNDVPSQNTYHTTQKQYRRDKREKKKKNSVANCN